MIKEAGKKILGIFGNMHMNKKAQLTIFVILGIIIVAGIAAYFILKNYGIGVEGGEISSYDIKPVNNFVTECVKKTGEDAIYQIGKTGGYVFPPEPRMTFDENSDEGIAFYLYDKGYKKESSSSIPSVPGPPTPAIADEEGKDNYIPSKERIEKELSKYMDSFLYICMNDFENFPNFNITQGDAKTTTKIENGKVIFSVSYPLKIERGQKVSFIEDFEAVVTVRLNEIYSFASEIMDEQMQNTEAICMSCFDEMIDKYGMKVNMMESDEGIIFSILDEKSKINDKDYMFYFVNNYD